MEVGHRDQSVFFPNIDKEYPSQIIKHSGILTLVLTRKRVDPPTILGKATWTIKRT